MTVATLIRTENGDLKKAMWLKAYKFAAQQAENKHTTKEKHIFV